VAIAANQALMKLITAEDDHMDLNYLKRYDPVFRRVMNYTSRTSSELASNNSADFSPLSTGVNEGSPPNVGTADSSVTNSGFQLQPVIEVLSLQLLNKSVETRIAVLRWMLNLHNRLPKKMFLLADQLFPILLSSLSDSSDEVVLLDLEVIAEVSSSSAEGVIKSLRTAALQHSPEQSPPTTPGSRRKKKSKSVSNDSEIQISRPDGLEATALKAAEKNNLTIYFTKFMTNLVSLFSTDRQLLEDRGSFIVRQLCLLLDPKDIYCAFAEILLLEEDLKFASTMVRNLNMILLTSVELLKLRNELRDLKTKDSVDLFQALYHSWSHNPVATISVCLLTQNYRHACNLICKFAEINVNASMLSEIDKLVQLIESPVFVYLRLQLLEPDRYHHLIKALNGLLMLLPQSAAFTTLKHRLKCVPAAKQAPLER
jgi:vacuole morphology and inheritance protein 14